MNYKNFLCAEIARSRETNRWLHTELEKTKLANEELKWELEFGGVLNENSAATFINAVFRGLITRSGHNAVCHHCGKSFSLEIMRDHLASCCSCGRDPPEENMLSPNAPLCVETEQQALRYNMQATKIYQGHFEHCWVEQRTGVFSPVASACVPANENEVAAVENAANDAERTHNDEDSGTAVEGTETEQPPTE